MTEKISDGDRAHSLAILRLSQPRYQLPGAVFVETEHTHT